MFGSRRRTRPLFMTALFVVVALGAWSSMAMAVLYKGREHTAIGNALLTVSGDSLVVSNLGSSGNDGVSIALTGTAFEGKEFVIASPTLSRPGVSNESFIELSALGNLGGVPNTLASTQRTTRATNSLQGTFDLSPLSPSSGIGIFAFQNGALRNRGNSSNVTGSATMGLALDLTWSISLPPDLDICGSFSTSAATFGATTVSLSGPGEHQFIFLAPCTQSFTEYNALELRGGGGITSFVIQNEMLKDTPVIAVPDLSPWGLSVLTLLLLIAGTIAIRRTPTARRLAGS